MSFTLAIVGRPNVGKSTLFNRLVGKKIALVDDQPGVTRDLREGKTTFKNISIKLLDTAGLESAVEETLQHKMSALSLDAIKKSDACLFVIDARTGITAADEMYASIVRKTCNSVILVVNKVEGRDSTAGVYESFVLGLGDPVSISAEHGIGIAELKEKIFETIEIYCNDKPRNSKETETPEDNEIIGDNLPDLKNFDALSSDKEIQLSIIGRPNSGKSTLTNRIIGNQRLLTGPEAGITRDAISTSINWLGKKFCIIDTAGMRKKSKVHDKLEKLSVSDAIKAIRFSEMIVLLLDVSSPFDSQDLKIADLTEREGRCLVIAVNKWDLEKNKIRKFLELKQSVNNLLPQLYGVPLVPISGVSGAGVQDLQRQVLRAYKVWNVRISTSKLNNWLLEKLSSHPPPSIGGKRIRMRYITQVKTRPPSFVIFVSLPERVPESYKRYLVNGLRKDFGLPGIPIRLILRAGKNPYDDKRVKTRLIS